MEDKRERESENLLCFRQNLQLMRYNEKPQKKRKREKARRDIYFGGPVTSACYPQQRKLINNSVENSNITLSTFLRVCVFFLFNLFSTPNF